MDRDIKKLFFSCETCQINQAMPQKGLFHNWERTNSLWGRLHVDCAGSFQGKMFSIIVDYFSKCVEVISLNNTSSKSSIKVLQHCFTNPLVSASCCFR